MKHKRGYILLDMMVSLFIILIIIVSLYTTIVVSNNMNTRIEDKVELSQQMEEIDYQLKTLIGTGIDIINIKTLDNKVISNLEYNYKYNVSSIKINLKNEDNKNDSSLKNKEISLKSNKKKLFINTINSNNISESGGYEIGNYVKNIYFKLENPKLVSITLCLQKNNTSLEKNIKIYMKSEA